MKLNINDYVYYALNGICQVTEIKKLKIGNEEKEYYVLTPINNKSTFFLPLDNKEALSKIKKILNKEEIDEIIITSKNIELSLPKNSKDRNTYIQSILKQDDLKSTIALIRTLINKQKEENKLSPNDLIALSNAENLVSTSLSYSLNISKEEVEDYILKLLK